jgi:predicted transposase/invertase (TIGR01784 family)
MQKRPKSLPPEVFAPLTSDFAFKAVFGDQKHSENLAALLKTIIDLPADDYGRLTIEDPYLKRFRKKDKLGILDVKVHTKSGRVINVELQVSPSATLLKRILFYLTKIYSDQLDWGEKYTNLNPAYSVVICDHRLLPDETAYLNHYTLHNKKSTKELTDLLNVCILELPKLPAADDGTAVWPWAKMFLCKTKDEVDSLVAQHSEVTMAAKLLKRINLFGIIKANVDYELDRWRTKQMFIDDARAEGLSQGRTEGLAEGRTEALDLMRQGYTVEQIEAMLAKR